MKMGGPTVISSARMAKAGKKWVLSEGNATGTGTGGANSWPHVFMAGRQEIKDKGTARNGTRKRMALFWARRAGLHR